MARSPLARRARAYAPGGIGNLGPGLDVLGCAVTGAGDIVDVEWSDADAGVDLVVADAGHRDLPRDPMRNAAAIAGRAVLRHCSAGRHERTIVLRITKGLPLAGGQGGSGASAVAGAVAVNALLGSPLDRAALLPLALEGEAQVAGRHADNVAASLLGGIVLVRTLDPLDVIRVPYPTALRIVLTLPQQQLRTADARAVLPPSLPRELALRQAANIAAMMIAFGTGDLALLARAVHDDIAEPARAPLLPGFREAQAAALGAGALGCSISGAGPSAFAFAPDDKSAERIAGAMRSAYAGHGIAATSRVARIDEQGARVESPNSTGGAADRESR